MKRLRLLSTLLILFICFSLHAEIVSGTCGGYGDNLTWSFDTESGLLKIEGSGVMQNFRDSSCIPWHLYRDQILQVNLPNGLTSIGQYAFSGCTRFTSMTIPNSVTTIGEHAFLHCTGLTSIMIPNSVTNIGEYAFCNCTGLTSINIPASMTRIEVGTFHGCTGLTSITLPNSVTNIGSAAFAGCTGLTSIDIPDSIDSLETSVFHGCTNLLSITIPNSIITIGEMAFYDCRALTSVTIPNSITTIGEMAFADCIGLTSVTIPNSVVSIGDGAFRDCNGLNDIIIVNDMFVFMPKNYSGDYTIPSNIKKIIGSAFSRCINLTSITLPNSVTNIGSSAFVDCTGLTSLTIPNSVANIGDGAFAGCSGLTSVTIPNSVTSIGMDAFQQCGNIEILYINTSINPNIPGCEELYIGDDVTTVYEYYYSYYHQLRKVVLGKKVSQIRAQAFSNANIQEFTITGEEPPYCYPNIFGTQDLSAATLYVPANKAEYYQTTEPWTKFGTVKTLEGETPVIPTACEKPAIAFENGKLLFTCGTNGAKYHCTITSPDMKNNELNESGVVDLQACYDIYVYATADGFTQSETATAKLYWVKADGVLSGINQVERRGIVVSSDNGFVNVSGLNDSEQVTLYSTEGKLLGTQSAQGGACIFTTFEKVVIVKIGDSSFKVLVK